MRMRSVVVVCWLVVSGWCICWAKPCQSQGEVRDSSGAPVVGATVQSPTGQTITDASGHFVLVDGCGEITVRANGFATERVSGTQQGEPIVVRLKVSRLEERISVEADGVGAENMTVA